LVERRREGRKMKEKSERRGRMKVKERRERRSLKILKNK